MKTKPRIPRGFRDFPPDIMILRKYVINKIENVFIKYGFDPIETPAIELWEVLSGKYGGEAEKLIWKFQDTYSGEWYGLRYDLTVPLARFVALVQLPRPFKRYHIGRVWRHERPQKGRYREFWQADADIVGSPYPEADAEVISLTIDAFLELGFKNFILKLNDRRLLSGIFEEELKLAKYGEKKMLEIFRAIDKLDKIGIEGVENELRKIGLKDTEITKIREIIAIHGETEEILSQLLEKFGRNEKVKIAIDHIMQILDNIPKDLLKFIQFDLSLVRGLDYYTGPCWEIVIPDVKIGSLSGGGRYDDLIGIYTGEKIPATGTSLGVERIIDAGLILEIFKLNRKTYTRVFIVTIDKKYRKYANEIARIFRMHGIPTQIDLMRRTWRKQVEYAKKKRIKVIAFIGEKESKTRTITIHIPDENKHFDQISIEKAIEIIKEI